MIAGHGIMVYHDCPPARWLRALDIPFEHVATKAHNPPPARSISAHRQHISLAHGMAYNGT